LADHAGSRLDLRVDVVQSGSQVTGQLASVSSAGSGGGFGDGN
jgi:hypothetical protein